MSWGINVYKLASLTSYENAHKYFNRTAKPPRSQKWCENSRPLKGVSDAHYALRRGKSTRGLYYDLVLFKTPLVRYWQPDDLIADGTEHVWLRAYNTQTSWAFLHRAGWWQGKTLRTTEGKDAKLFLNHWLQSSNAKPEHDHALMCNGWSANLVMKNGLLVVEQSKHVPAYVYKSTREDTQRRAEFKQAMDTFATLMCYRIPEMHRNMKTHYWALRDKGRPYGGVTTTLPWEFDYHKGDEMPEGVTKRLIAFSEDVYATMVAKRWYAEEQKPSGGNAERLLYTTLDATVYKKGLLAAMLRKTNKNGNSLRVTVPQFTNTLPRNYVYF